MIFNTLKFFFINDAIESVNFLYKIVKMENFTMFITIEPIIFYTYYYVNKK